ncbi:hypothetical protein MY5147_003913 [Beauveria neobassiana]
MYEFVQVLLYQLWLPLGALVMVHEATVGHLPTDGCVAARSHHDPGGLATEVVTVWWQAAMHLAQHLLGPDLTHSGASVAGILAIHKM